MLWNDYHKGMYHIYAIRNKINRKLYIGQTNNLERRFYEHMNYAKRRSYITHPFYNAINKYGEDNFEIIRLGLYQTLEETNEAEEFWIEWMNACDRRYGYNIGKGGDNREMSPETIQKLSEMNSGEGNPFYGKHHSEETKINLSIAHIGMKASEETKQKMSEQRQGEDNGMFGKHHSEQSRGQISQSRLQLFLDGKGTKSTKLNWDKANKIREDFKNGSKSAKQLSQEYGVAERHIYSIINNKKWIVK